MLRNLLRAVPLAAVLLVAACAPVAGQAVKSGAAAETVVLLHGLGRGPGAMWWLAERLEEAGYRVVRPGYSSLAQTPESILADLRTQLAQCCAARAAPVHFVGHSLGGLLVRAYLSRDRPANLGRAVLLGTPSGGTSVVDRYSDRWWFSMLGPTARVLGTGPDSFPRALARPDYPLGVIAGRKQSENESLLPGEDDGLVSVESTRVDGMADFLVVEAGHAAMRYDAQVAAQIVAFLETGRFSRSPTQATR